MESKHPESATMTINIEELSERALEQAFTRARDQAIQSRAEAVFRKALEEGSPLSKGLVEKIEQGLQRFMEEGIRWEKKAGFKE
jgi:hypothetical protein